MRAVVFTICALILCLIQINCAVPIKELPNDESLNESILQDSDNNGNTKRASRQVAVNVGPVGVGVGPFGGVGVRVGRLFNLGVAPSYPIAYAPVVPLAYPAPVPFANPGGYSYRSNYHYNYSY